MPIGHPGASSWVPQGLVMGAYGIAAPVALPPTWGVIAIVSAPGSTFRSDQLATPPCSRRAFASGFAFDLPPARHPGGQGGCARWESIPAALALRFAGRAANLPLTPDRRTLPLAELEQSGA